MSSAFMFPFQGSLKRRKGCPSPLFAGSQPAVQKVLWDPPVLHTVDMPELAKSTLPEQGEGDLGASEDLSVELYP